MVPSKWLCTLLVITMRHAPRSSRRLRCHHRMPKALAGSPAHYSRAAESTEGCSEARSKAEGARASEYSIRASGRPRRDLERAIDVGVTRARPGERRVG